MARKSHSADVVRFVEHAFSLARAVGVKTILVLENELHESRVIGEHRQDERLVWVRRGASGGIRASANDSVVTIPDSHLSRMGQIRVGHYTAVLGGEIGLAESVLCLSGRAESGRLDMLLVTRAKDDFPWLREEGLERTRMLVGPRGFGRLLELSLQFAAEGREGKPIGTTLVLGDPAELSPHLRQLILNPCAGHPARARSVHNPGFSETLRELTALDGAVVVNRKGVVESAGTYLDAPVRRTRLQAGRGARHAAAASVTAVTDAVAFVVSESSGTVTVFDDGRPVLELERPC